MLFTGVSFSVAPLATGHPLGLPAAPEPPSTQTKVQPVTQKSKTDADSGGQPPSHFWRGLAGIPDPANHIPPPSIMQIKISALLEQQAARLTEETDEAVAEASSAKPETEMPIPAMAEDSADQDGAPRKTEGPTESASAAAPVLPGRAEAGQDVDRQV